MRNELADVVVELLSEFVHVSSDSDTHVYVTSKHGTHQICFEGSQAIFHPFCYLNGQFRWKDPYIIIDLGEPDSIEHLLELCIISK